ncbi:MAG TPA: DUF2191 domain-containing protein [Verrucomicrobiae bacterium]|nr:DUF2191 domain-containing protein [Verrucomicrobiae bacterium]
MKVTIDIPTKELNQAIKNTGAKTRGEAILIAVQKYNKLQRLKALSERLQGSCPDFMTQEDLKIMREDAKWEAMK